MTSQYPELYADNDWSFMGTINEKKTNLLLVQFHKFSVAIIWCWHNLYNLRGVSISSLTHNKDHLVDVSPLSISVLALGSASSLWKVWLQQTRSVIGEHLRIIGWEMSKRVIQCSVFTSVLSAGSTMSRTGLALQQSLKWWLSSLPQTCMLLQQGN